VPQRFPYKLTNAGLFRGARSGNIEDTDSVAPDEFAQALRRCFSFSALDEMEDRLAQLLGREQRSF
jgi:hypothetical protein